MITITDLLLPPHNELTASIKQALDDEGVAVAAGGGPSVSLAALRLMAGALEKNLRGVLDQISLASILVGAWNKAFTVRQQLEKSAKSPGKELFLQLAEHRITSKHEPYIALMKDGHELGRVPFTVLIDFTLQGAVLRLLDGAIKQIQTGRIAKGKGTLKIGPLMLVEKEIQTIEVPGAIDAPAPATVAAALHIPTARQAS